MKQLFNKANTKTVIAPTWLGDIVYDTYFRKWNCQGETIEGWVYKQA